MGFFDSAKDALQNAVEEHPDQVAQAIDKAEDIVDQKTGGRYTDQISAGGDRLASALGVDGQAHAASAGDTQPPAGEQQG